MKTHDEGSRLSQKDDGSRDGERAGCGGTNLLAITGQAGVQPARSDFQIAATFSSAAMAGHSARGGGSGAVAFLRFAVFDRFLRAIHNLVQLTRSIIFSTLRKFASLTTVSRC